MHLEQRRAVVEGRPRAEARDAVADHAADPDAHRIDAVLQAAVRIQPRYSRSEIRDRARAGRPAPRCRRRTTDSRAVRRPRPRALRPVRCGSRTKTPGGLRPPAAARSRPRSRAARLARQKGRRAARADGRNGNRSRSSRRGCRAARPGCARRIPPRVSAANASSKVSTSAPSRPVLASSRSFDRASVRRNTGSDGRSTLRGCGSKVTAMAGRPSAARARPRCRSPRDGRDARRRNCRSPPRRRERGDLRRIVVDDEERFCRRGRFGHVRESRSRAARP